MTDANELDAAWKRNRDAQQGQGRLYKALAYICIVLIIFWFGTHFFSGEDIALNMWTEVISIAITVGLFGLINDWQAEQQYKRRLVDEAGSTSNETAKHAVHIMRRRGWLIGNGGLLKGQILNGANLQEADLIAANLQNAELIFSNLKKADLRGSDLRHAKLNHADLQGVNLDDVIAENADFESASFKGVIAGNVNFRNTNFMSVKLQTAEIHDTNFQGAELISAILREAKFHQVFFQNANLKNSDLYKAEIWNANLMDANLEDANLEEAIFPYTDFSLKTIMPDGNLWTPETDLSRFTDRDHPNFWRSPNIHSPARNPADWF